MTEEETTSHLVSYPDVKEPQKPLTEKHASPRKAAVLSFNPDGSLCIPADLKEKLVHQPSKVNSPNRPNTGSKENVTPDSRKRKKNAAPVGPAWVPPPKDCCHFCYSKDDTKKMGPLKEIDGILAHHSCLLFSSGLCQAGKNEEGLWGFLTPNIKKELSRGKRLKCSFCRLPGALVGCHKARCPHTYHLTCGFSNGCLMQYYDNFRSFCGTHRPRQNFLEEMLGKTVECAICGDMISVESKVVPKNILVTECCNMTPLHRECIQHQADASGYFFRCPMCNNEKKFNNIMKIMGINVPQSDAVWEKDGYYDDLYVEHWRCDVPICLHPDGRKGDSRNNDKWDLMRCRTCGQAGAHPYCLGHEKRGPKDWSCAACVTFEKNFEAVRLEEEKKRKAEAAANPESATSDQQTAGPSRVSTSSGSKSTDGKAINADGRKKRVRIRNRKQIRITNCHGNRRYLIVNERQILEEHYQKNHFLEPETKQEILSKIDISDSSLVRWYQKRRKQDYKTMNGVYESKWSLALDPSKSTRKFAWAQSGNTNNSKKLLVPHQASPAEPSALEVQESFESESTAGSSRGRKESSASSKRARRKTLSPSKDPFLMTPEALKEAVFKLCVAKLKKDKLIAKNLNPDKWIGLDSLKSDGSEEEISTIPEIPQNLVAKAFTLSLTKLKYTPPASRTAAAEVDLEEVEEYDEHKERLWELIVKHRRDKAFIRKVTKTSRSVRPPRGKQTTISSFFRSTSLNRNDRDNYTARAKRRKIETSDEPSTKKSKVKQENEYEPFPFKRSPHQSPYPSRDHSPDKHPLASSPTPPLEPEPEYPESEHREQLLKSPEKEEEETVETPEKKLQNLSAQLGVSPSSYKCYYCDDKFSKMSVRMDHMRNIHSKHTKGWDGSVGGRVRGKRSSSTSEKSDFTEEVSITKDSDGDEAEVVVTEPPDSAKETTSLRRTSRRTSSANSFKPLKIRKSSSASTKMEKSPRKKTPTKLEPKSDSTEPRRGRGRPIGSTKKKNRKWHRRKKRNSDKSEDEGVKYGELTIEVAERKEDTEESEEEEVEYVETIFAEPRDLEGEKRKRKKQGYDWSENEVFSLIEYYSSLPYLWDDSCKYEGDKDELIRKLESKLDIPASRITSKWKSLVSRYKIEKYNPGSDWRFLSALSFLEETNFTSCPEDVSPLFSLLTGADSQHHGDSDGGDEDDNTMNESQDIFPNLSDDEAIKDDDDCESKASDERSVISTSLTEEPVSSALPFPEEEDTKSLPEEADLPSFEEDLEPDVSAEEQGALTLKITNSFQSRRVSSTTEKCLDEEMMSPVEAVIITETLATDKSGNICGECGKCFPSRGKLMQHKLKLRYFCCHCSKNFSSVASLKQHQDGLDVMLHVCPFCQMFRNEESKHTIRHISENHVKHWITTECTECYAVFKNKEKALSHIRQKHGVRAEEAENKIRVRDFRCLYD